MKQKMRFLWLFLLVSIYFIGNSQNENTVPYKAEACWFGGLNLGVNSFWGDVNDFTNKLLPTTPFQSSFYQHRHIVLGGAFGKMIYPFWSLQIEFKLANLSGRDYRTGQEFYSYLNNEIAIITNIDFLKLANVKTNWTAYGRFGMGIYGFKTMLWNSHTGDMVNSYPLLLSPNATTPPTITKPSYYQYAFAIPFGVGTGYRILPELTVFFETSMTWINHDMVDAYQSDKAKFEGVWTSSIGVTYQFNFPAVRVNHVAGAKVYDPALKKDNVDEEYQRKKRNSSVIFKPATSHSKSAVKNKKAKRKTFSF